MAGDVVLTDAEADAILEAVLRAAGTLLRHYTAYTKDKMREALRQRLADADTRAGGV